MLSSLSDKRLLHGSAASVFIGLLREGGNVHHGLQKSPAFRNILLGGTKRREREGGGEGGGEESNKYPQMIVLIFNMDEVQYTFMLL